MTPKDLRSVHAAVDKEGIDYAFACYSRFSKIADDEFHAKRIAYLKARKDLLLYLGFDDNLGPVGRDH